MGSECSPAEYTHEIPIPPPVLLVSVAFNSSRDRILASISDSFQGPGMLITLAGVCPGANLDGAQRHQRIIRRCRLSGCRTTQCSQLHRSHGRDIRKTASRVDVEKLDLLLKVSICCEVVGDSGLWVLFLRSGKTCRPRLHLSLSSANYTCKPPNGSRSV